MATCEDRITEYLSMGGMGPAADLLVDCRTELEALRSELARVKAQLDDLKIENDENMRDLEISTRLFVKRAKELEEARKVIEPFATFADALNEQIPDDISIGIFADGAMRFGPSGGACLRHLRAARDFLASLTQGETR